MTTSSPCAALSSRGRFCWMRGTTWSGTPTRCRTRCARRNSRASRVSSSGFSDHFPESHDVVVVAVLGDLLRHVDVAAAAALVLEILAGYEYPGTQRDRSFPGAEAGGRQQHSGFLAAPQGEAPQLGRARHRPDADPPLLVRDLSAPPPHPNHPVVSAVRRPPDH